jgi:hypothetical protein
VDRHHRRREPTRPRMPWPRESAAATPPGLKEEGSCWGGGEPLGRRGAAGEEEGSRWGAARVREEMGCGRGGFRCEVYISMLPNLRSLPNQQSH